MTLGKAKEVDIEKFGHISKMTMIRDDKKHKNKRTLTKNIVRVLISVLSICMLMSITVLAYENHCWNCDNHISSNYCKKCRECGWYICTECGACYWDCSLCFNHDVSVNVEDDEFADEAYEAYLADQERKQQKAEYEAWQSELQKTQNNHEASNDDETGLFDWIWICIVGTFFAGVFLLAIIAFIKSIYLKIKERHIENSKFKIASHKEKNLSWRRKRADYNKIMTISNALYYRWGELNLTEYERIVQSSYPDWIKRIAHLYYGNEKDTGDWSNSYLKRIDINNARRFNCYAYKYFMERLKSKIGLIEEWEGLFNNNQLQNTVNDITKGPFNCEENPIKNDMTKAFMLLLQGIVFKEEDADKHNYRILHSIENITDSVLIEMINELNKAYEKKRRRLNNRYSLFDDDDDDNIPF